MVGSLRVDFQRELPDPIRELRADQIGTLLETDVLVVLTDLCLGRRREDRLWQPLGHLQAGRQRYAAHAAGALIVLPAGTDQVATHDRLDGQRLESPDHRGAGRDRASLIDVRQHVLQAQRGQVIRDNVCGASEPEV